jgi:hypothetical protein
MGEVDEGLLVCCSGTNTGMVVVMGTGTAVIFFKLTSIWSYLAAIQLSVALSCTKLSFMALKFPSVVVITTSNRFGTTRSNGGKYQWEFLCGIFEEETLL